MRTGHTHYFCCRALVVQAGNLSAVGVTFAGGGEATLGTLTGSTAMPNNRHRPPIASNCRSRIPREPLGLVVSPVRPGSSHRSTARGADIRAGSGARWRRPVRFGSRPCHLFRCLARDHARPDASHAFEIMQRRFASRPPIGRVSRIAASCWICVTAGFRVCAERPPRTTAQRDTALQICSIDGVSCLSASARQRRWVLEDHVVA